MTPRMPSKQDFATLDALERLEKVVGENSNSIKQIVTLLGGDPFKNGKGIVDRLCDVEKFVKTLREDIRTMIREELKNFSQNGNDKSKSEKFKDFPLWKKFTAIVVITSALGIGGTGILEILNKIIEFLIRFVGGS